ncbi:hypothetical protein RFI_09252, partial [Reticulomyxa filosa]
KQENEEEEQFNQKKQDMKNKLKGLVYNGAKRAAKENGKSVELRAGMKIEFKAPKPFIDGGTSWQFVTCRILKIGDRYEMWKKRIPFQVEAGFHQPEMGDQIHVFDFDEPSNETWVYVKHCKLLPSSIEDERPAEYEKAMEQMVNDALEDVKENADYYHVLNPLTKKHIDQRYSMADSEQRPRKRKLGDVIDPKETGSHCWKKPKLALQPHDDASAGGNDNHPFYRKLKQAKISQFFNDKQSADDHPCHGCSNSPFVSDDDATPRKKLAACKPEIVNEHEESNDSSQDQMTEETLPTLSPYDCTNDHCDNNHNSDNKNKTDNAVTDASQGCLFPSLNHMPQDSHLNLNCTANDSSTEQELPSLEPIHTVLTTDALSFKKKAVSVAFLKKFFLACFPSTKYLIKKLESRFFDRCLPKKKM